VVSPPLKNISQWEGLSHILWNIKNVPNHQPVRISPRILGNIMGSMGSMGYGSEHSGKTLGFPAWEG
jgi:hypothetical protein